MSEQTASDQAPDLMEEVARGGDLRTSSSRRRLLVPTDFSRSSDRALILALDLARGLRAMIEIVHVQSLPIYSLPPPVEMLAPTVIAQEVLADIDHQLTRVCDRVRSNGLVCESITLIGEPHAEILKRAAESGASMIVMGTHGRTGLSHALLGSVAERVVQRALCPVLVVPSAERAKVAPPTTVSP
jgi:nucleotide-binding universal stress UspA family protein